MSTNRFATRRGKLILASVATAMALGMVLAAEFACRLVTSSDTVLNTRLGGFRETHPVRRTQLKRNYRAPGIAINSLGTLGPEFEIDPPHDKVRILAIGDSVTFNPVHRNYPRVLDEVLNERFGSDTVEVVVGAIPGYSSIEARLWFDEFLGGLGADITLIYLGWNDMGQYHPFGLAYKNEGLYQKPTLAGWLMEHSHLARLPYAIAGVRESRGEIDLAPLTPDEARKLEQFVPTHYEENLRHLVQESQKAGSEVRLISLTSLLTHEPTPEDLAKMHFPRNTGRKLAIYQRIYEKYVASLEKVATELNVTMIDLSPLVADPADREIFTDTMHVNEQGAERYARHIADALDPQVKSALQYKLHGRLRLASTERISR
jgi:lysophospholipase L1-like esterase